jgi:hypothetical protein
MSIHNRKNFETFQSVVQIGSELVEQSIHFAKKSTQVILGSYQKEYLKEVFYSKEGVR